MKVSIESILGSARNMNARKENTQVAESDRNRSDVKGDSLSIESRIDSRIDSLGREFKDLQNSLTRNQVVMSGLNALRDDASSGGRNAEAIMNSTLFNNQRVLLDELGTAPSVENTDAAFAGVTERIDSDIADIKRLQVELDNITAANLIAPDRSDGLINRIENYLTEYTGSLENISSINPDSVMRLTR